MRGVERSLDGVERATKSAGLQTGRLGNQFAGLAGHIAQVHPIVGNLAGVLGNFSIGAGLTVGVLGGLAAIALAYDSLTRSAREAATAQDSAVKSLVAMIRARAGLGPATTLAQAHGQESRLMKREGELQNELRANKGIPGLEQLTRGKLEDVQLQLENLRNVIKLSTDILESDIKARNAESLAAEQRKQAAAHAKVEAALRKQESDLIAYNNLMRSIYGDISMLTPETTKAMRGRLQLERAGSSTEQFGKDLAEVVKEQAISGQFGGGFSMPNIGLNDGITKEQRKNLEKMGVFVGDNADKNADMVKDAIWGSAATLANTLVSALNIGGGGKGSNLGGAIGSTAGFALGMTLTGGSPIGGAIGSLLGNIGGSLIGGLFDHKKAIDTNTAAVRQNTAALLMNAPSVYKSARGRFDSTDIKPFQRASTRYATRGGAPVMVVP